MPHLYGRFSSLEQALGTLRQQYGEVAIFLHLDPLPEEQGQLDEKSVVKTVFLLAKHLKEPLNQAAANRRAIFMTAVRLDGEFGLGGQANFEPVSGGLFVSARRLPRWQASTNERVRWTYCFNRSSMAWFWAACMP